MQIKLKEIAMATIATDVKQHNVVSHDEWIRARKEFLKKEKEFTRQRDEISRMRREMPWEKVEKRYDFEGRGGKASLADLFGMRSQLIVYHFMLGPGWKEGCPSCSYLADHFDGMTIHLANRDVTFAVVSHAPLAEIETFKKRMGWKFNWYSSDGSDFNYDYQVSLKSEEEGKPQVYYNYEMVEFPATERPGLSVFFKDASAQVFHTYSTYARGLDILVGTYNFLDVAPKGRDEAGLKHTMAWVRHHDKYGEDYAVDRGAGYVQPEVVAAKPAAGKCCHD
ncbi:conserved hypothetical protein [Candidatus Sulfotelmatomonas gaucii]|uniref:DUF899 domain-containing protein n=1 Tax=Candidatus Sulfuritelmatomonas gaucii TaxID=2043161 RepID=A0A2N9LLC8_9BACT|nr:conserved hypothetical protein [Candidatus Sulfotelmatomonas gaucii]